MAVNKLDITMMEDVGTSASQLLQRDGSGNLPAVDASQVSGLSEFTTSTSDPAIDANLSVGSLWYNKTSGEMYVCTDATAGSNVWTNVGAGSGNIPVYSFQFAQISGYAMTGYTGSNVDRIDKWSVTSDADATDVGNMSAIRDCGGYSSSTTGYQCGGYDGSRSNRIHRMTFASDSDSVDSSNLTLGRSGGCSGSESETHGYWTGGYSSSAVNTIDKMQFSTNADATDVGDLSSTLQSKAAGINSLTHSFTAGGTYHTTVIDKWSHASDGNGSATGTLSTGRASCTGQQDATHGYASGGGSGVEIDRFAFASDGATSNVGSLTVGGDGTYSCSSATYGYNAGSYPSQDVIDKYQFQATADSSDVGNLTLSRGSGASAQV